MGIEKKLRWYDEIESGACVVILMFMLVILFYQVVARYCFGVTNAWCDELSRYTLVWFGYLSACYAIVHNAHIKIDLFTKIWPKAWRSYIKLFSNVIFFIYAVVVAYYSAEWLLGLMKSGAITLGLKLPMALFCAIIPLSHIIMALRLIQLEYRLIKYPELLSEDPEDELATGSLVAAIFPDPLEDDGDREDDDEDTGKREGK
jgi:TRAP-type C4-dicarboxylate transport system permease small subunit